MAYTPINSINLGFYGAGNGVGIGINGIRRIRWKINSTY